MSNTPQPSQEASAAWQDVEQLVINTSVRTSTGRKTWAAIEHARAADAQQIAALKELQQMTLANEIRWMQKWEASEQQIAAAEQENVVLHNTCGQYEEDLKRQEQQIAALRAENEQLRDALKRENKEICEAVADAVRWQVRYREAQLEVARLKAAMGERELR